MRLTFTFYDDKEILIKLNLVSFIDYLINHSIGNGGT